MTDPVQGSGNGERGHLGIAWLDRSVSDSVGDVFSKCPVDAFLAGAYDLAVLLGEVALVEPHRMLRLVATVTGGSGLKWVHARYRGLTQHKDFKTVTLWPTQNPNEFEGIIPSEDLDPKFDFMYFFEVMDQSGQGKIFPDLNRETPYWVVPVRR